jgi:alpha-glucosidase
MTEPYNKKLPEVHDVMRKLRSTADEYGAVLIGETWTTDVSELKDYYGTKNDELQMPMDLMMTNFKGLSADQYRKHIAAVNSAGHWPVWVITNHDIVRSYTRYGDGTHDDDIAKMMAALYLTLRGSAIMYYGEEIGMQNNDPKRKEDVQDPIGKLGWPVEKGRDGERTPMQWTAGTNAGFSEAKPWLPVPQSAVTHNVETEKKDPNSIYNFYRKLLEMHHKEPALLDGDYIVLNESDPNVLVYARRYKDDVIVVALNMSASGQNVKVDLSPLGLAMPKTTVLLKSYDQSEMGASEALPLPAYGAYIARVSK